jgi:hypothetical protein
MSCQSFISIPNIPARVGNGHENGGRFPVRESRADDWITTILRKPEHLDDNVLPLRLYKDLQVITADHEMRKGHVDAALFHLRVAARACFDLGENEQGTHLMERVDAIQIDRANAIGKKDSFSVYLSALQREANDAIKVGNLNRTRDLLRQLAVLSTSIGDYRTSTDYKNQLRSIETVYLAKGSRSITVQKVFRSRLVHALREATMRHELAFRETFADHAKVLRPILMESFSV